MKTIFLKLGGSLVTDKDDPYTARLKVIRSIGRQIRRAMGENPGLRLLIGHGSGSFGHTAATDVGFVEGDRTAYNPAGFQMIWLAAQKLNRVVVNEFNKIGLPVISCPPSAAIDSAAKKILAWNTGPIRNALNQGLLPLIFGDAVLDSRFGGVIYSTEEQFLYLMDEFNPDLILLAGKEEGVWADFPQRQKLLTRISNDDFSRVRSSIEQSQSVDVTGGMLKKVQLMLKAKEKLPSVRIFIFSGEKPDGIYQCLTENCSGTAIL